jgi:hypothetical protein
LFDFYLVNSIICAIFAPDKYIFKFKIVKVMRKNILSLLGAGALLAAFALNLNYAVNDYGVIDNEQHECVLAQSNSSGGGGDDSSGGGSGDGSSGGDSSGGDSGDSSGSGTTGGGTTGEYTGSYVLKNCTWTITYFSYDSDGKKIKGGFSVKTCKDCAYTCNFEKIGNCKAPQICPSNIEEEEQP